VVAVVDWRYKSSKGSEQGTPEVVVVVAAAAAAAA